MVGRMTAYPQMFALLDIRRTIQGLRNWTGPESSDAEAESWYSWVSEDGQHRRRYLNELSTTLRDDLAWVHEPPEHPHDWHMDRSVTAPVERDHVRIDDVLLSFDTGFRPIIPAADRQRLVLARISFDGGNWVEMLATEDPPYAAILNLLQHIQPIHAFVINEVMYPGATISSDDPGMHKAFQRAWCHVYDSTFLGPELVRQIPEHFFDPVNGFSHIERVGEGVWITFKGVGFRGTETDEEEFIFERHRAACQQITNFIKTLAHPFD